MSKYLGLLLLLLLAACGAPVESTATLTLTPPPLPPTDTPAPSPTATLPPTPTPLLPDPPLGLTQYTLQAELDYYAHQVEVSQQVVYPNRSDEALNELVFIAHPALFPFTLEVEAVTWGDGAAVQGWKLENGKLTLPLRTPLPPYEAVFVNFEFKLNIPARDSTFGYTAMQTNLANWFFMLPPYQPGTGWIAHDAYAYGEYMVYEAADFDVRLKFKGGEGLVTAAGAPAQPEGEWTRYQLRAARNFVFSVSPYYRTATAGADGVTVTSYWFTPTDAAGQEAARVAARALALYGELFGPYPRPSFAVIEADFLHGMEYDGLTLLSRGFYEFYDGTPQTNLTIILPHEVSHQWWYSLVGNDQALEPWLDEATATYCELLYYERYHPELVQWWWDNRVNFFNPGGWVDATIYNAGGYDAYRNAVYLRGARFYADLRAAMGEEAFFAFLKAYARERAYGIATAAGFAAQARAFSPADLTPVFETYFQRVP